MEQGLPKNVQDEATKKTAQDALFSKINSAGLGYFTDDYSKLFTKKKRKWMPIINRGTWTRVFSVRTLINNFLQKYKSSSVQILSLGAGFDTNFFYYEENEAEFKENNVKYYEVDFPDICAQKVNFIKENESMQSLIFKADTPIYEGEDTIQAARYKLLPWDIRETEDLIEKLTQAGINQKIPTLILTEWVLCYMEHVDSLKVLKAMTDFFTDVALVNFEMINPNDPFGQTMVENLETRGCQLLGLSDVPDEESQINRMIECGFKNGYCENMLRIHNSQLNSTEKSRIEALEMFDEFEEWDLIQTHYCICIGSKLSDETELSF